MGTAPCQCQRSWWEHNAIRRADSGYEGRCSRKFSEAPLRPNSPLPVGPLNLMTFAMGGTPYAVSWQRTKPREYKIVITHTKETFEDNTWHHPAPRSTLCWTPYPQNKLNQNKNTIITRQNYHFTQPRPSEEKQTKTHRKSHLIGTIHKSLDRP